MSEQLPPFRTERYAIGPLRNGVAAALRPMTAKGAQLLGPGAAAIGPWAHYCFDGAKLAEALARVGDSAMRYQLECGGEIAGAVVIVCPWLSGPYLQMLAILPAHQKQGIGAAILGWFESEARGHFRNVWLCVSGFNVEAQSFYRAHGYERVATLDGLMRDGDDELLMRKRIVP
jgi:ribosomal protein S18 acetylase RimI-like enzyme